MAGPQSKELTACELVVMRAFWDEGSGTGDQARQQLADAGVCHGRQRRAGSGRQGISQVTQQVTPVSVLRGTVI